MVTVGFIFISNNFKVITGNIFISNNVKVTAQALYLLAVMSRLFQALYLLVIMSFLVALNVNTLRNCCLYIVKRYLELFYSCITRVIG